MPVANSSVGWTQNADGNLALSLALVVLSISLSPVVAPTLLSVLGMSLSPEEQQRIRGNFKRFREMTPEQRQQLRQRWQRLSPEQRQQIRQRLREQRRPG